MKAVTVIIIFLNFFLNLHAQLYPIPSPSGEIKLLLSTSGYLNFTITRKGEELLQVNKMGFSFKGEPDMGADLTVLSKNEKEVNESWNPVIKSKHELVKNHYKEVVFKMIERSDLKRKLDLEIRVFDDGVAFRYRLYRSGIIGSREITSELTTYSLPAEAKAWVADYKSYSSGQEAEFKPLLLKELKSGVKAGLPLLIEKNIQSYLAIAEAKIVNYPGFYLGLDINTTSGKIALNTLLAPLKGEGDNGVKARFATEITTPWRVIMVGKQPGRLIESEIIQNLNDSCTLSDVSWIKPGISAWDHWWSGEVKMDMPTIKQYIDFAGIQGWPYMLIDWQWYGKFNSPESDITKADSKLNMQELLDYARDRRVKLWLWLYSNDVNRNSAFKDAFALYEKWGIAGVKIDFMERDDQEMVNWYREIIESAAQHHLMVDFHGAFKPDGIIRTFPNMITREGVLGEEFSKFSNRVTADHNLTIPFTRMLAGQMDYTPGGFLNVTREAFKKRSPTEVMNSRAAELAKFIIYESPFTVFSDHPDHVLGQPGADFLKLVPTVWDDIYVPSGYPGEHVVMVKRSGKQYFIGAMNNSTPRKLMLNLDFLPKGVYELTYWSDASDAGKFPTHVIKRKLIVTTTSSIKINMSSDGGYVGILNSIK
ncbi:glycoside hydrolase family 97 protein [Pedobacter frigidisoli]|uniref:glycoside hydrolase family 97 protein n=1 Tax=Pedobacter frigidisoli TaxID=2530455 RepID=UPI00292F6ABA|nr:glycoside hydrolase family 97 protein [Pedobacter frigidisoli]